MGCKRLTKCAFLIVFAVACSREPKTPPPAAPGPSITTTAPAPRTAAYEDAVRWFRTTPGFHFVVEEAGVRAEGEMTRATVGAEEVRVTVNGEQWSAKASERGLVWQRGGKETAAPEWGNRIFQRVTIAFDPKKSEGAAQLIEPGHFRFTDANSGAVHDVHLNDAGQIEKMTIGKTASMSLTNAR